MKKSHIGNHKGITLIALVVTIILLLLIAGIPVVILTRRKFVYNPSSIHKICKQSSLYTRTSRNEKFNNRYIIHRNYK